jgi:hypothetical protein
MQADFLSAESIPEYQVVIDPGHGGYSFKKQDDKWDPVTKKYLDFYTSGMKYGNYEEHYLMMLLAREISKRLQLTSTDEGWNQFKNILKKFTDSDNLPRINLKSVMTRTESWSERYETPPEDVNDPYRLYDFPDRTNNKRIKPGRISFINAAKAHLVLSLHMTPGGRGHPGGMAAVLSPGFQTFDSIRQIQLADKPRSVIEESPWFTQSLWIITDENWSRFESARADAWVYFHGYRSLKDGSGYWKDRNRGLRHNMVTWNYSDPAGWESLARMNQPGPYSLKYKDFQTNGKFWDREKSEAERWRREGGPLGFGGDNHYATDELMRFLQFKMRSLHSIDKKRYPSPGPIQPPYVSAYSLPMYINAVSAYIETGFLDKDTDRLYMLKYRADLADALAAGIYSLFQGLAVKSGNMKFKPKGAPLNFAKYEQIPEGNYFRAADPQ